MNPVPVKQDINFTIYYKVGVDQHKRLAEKRQLIKAYIHAPAEAYPIDGFFFDVSQSALIYCGRLSGLKAEERTLQYILAGV
jgi:hypothetical protein